MSLPPDSGTFPSVNIIFPVTKKTKGLGDLVDEMIKFYIDNKEDVDNKKGLKYQEYMGFLDTLNERENEFKKIIYPRSSQERIFKNLFQII